MGSTGSGRVWCRVIKVCAERGYAIGKGATDLKYFIHATEANFPIEQLNPGDFVTGTGVETPKGWRLVRVEVGGNRDEPQHRALQQNARASR